MTVLSQPKPTKATRPERVITTKGLMLSKVEPWRSPEFRAWVRARGTCQLAGWDASCGTKPDRQPFEAAHIGHGGMAEKASDGSCVNLCPVHHDLLDQHRLSDRTRALLLLWDAAVSLRDEYLSRELPVGHETREELLAGMKLLLSEIRGGHDATEDVIAWLESTANNNEIEFKEGAR